MSDPTEQTKPDNARGDQPLARVDLRLTRPPSTGPGVPHSFAYSLEPVYVLAFSCFPEYFLNIFLIFS